MFILLLFMLLVLVYFNRLCISVLPSVINRGYVGTHLIGITLDIQRHVVLFCVQQFER
jgi:hypothetical protein